MAVAEKSSGMPRVDPALVVAFVFVLFWPHDKLCPLVDIRVLKLEVINKVKNR